jgi:glycopeptide antibiotics resistance protein
MWSAGLMGTSLWQKIWLAWILVIVVVTTAPWTSFQSIPINWHRINWVPYSYAFTKFRIFSRDILQNIVLYAPFGYCYVKSFPFENRYPVLLIGMFACTLSLLTEAAQVYNAHRFPSATDVVNNVFGALLGASFGRWRSQQKNSIG